jgi:phosphohistidine phosphatase
VKTLFLLRHAKSSWADQGQRDFDRPLNARGHAAAVRIGEELAGLGIQFDHVLASPARRVVETIEGVARGLGRPLGPHFDPLVYGADAAGLLALIAAVPDPVRRLLVIGHNPTLHEVALRLTGDERLAGNFPTAAFAEISVDVERWAEVGDAGGKLARFIRPRELD